MSMRRFFRDRLGRRGMAAVEFALVMPLVIPLMIGMIEIFTLYRTEAKLNAVSFNVAQMISIDNATSTTGTGGNKGITTLNVSATGSTSLNDICKGVAWDLSPLPASGITFAIAGVTLESQTASSATTDFWEQDGKLSGGTCATTATTTIGQTAAQTLVEGTGNGFKGSTTGLLEVPCDNAILVQLSMTYPGILGVFLQNRPVVTQTAYIRWRYAGAQTELECAGCTTMSYQSGSGQICNSNNAATN